MPQPTIFLLPYGMCDGPFNMGLDDALLDAAAALEFASLRLYGWSKPTLSLGYFQTAASRLNDPLLAELPYVRRPSGGGAIVHHHELTYALTLPPGPPWQKRGESWIQRMHAMIRTVLQYLSIRIPTTCAVEEKKLDPFLCFRHHTPCDLLIGPHKVVGSAQRKSRGALLQHGSILLAQSPHTPSLPGLHELAGFALDGHAQAALAAGLLDAFAHDTGWKLEIGGCRPEMMLVVRHLIQVAGKKYTSPEWNDKR